MLAALILAASLAVAPLATPTPGQFPLSEKELGVLKSERAGMCPDGSAISLRLYDPNPASSDVNFVFARGNVVVAVRQITATVDRVYVVAEGRWYTTDEIRERYPSPCDIPSSGR